MLVSEVNTKNPEWIVTYTVFNAAGEPAGTKWVVVPAASKQLAAKHVRLNYSTAIVNVERV